MSSSESSSDESVSSSDSSNESNSSSESAYGSDTENAIDVLKLSDVYLARICDTFTGFADALSGYDEANQTKRVFIEFLQKGQNLIPYFNNISMSPVRSMLNYAGDWVHDDFLHRFDMAQHLYQWDFDMSEYVHYFKHHITLAAGPASPSIHYILMQVIRMLKPVVEGAEDATCEALLRTAFASLYVLTECFQHSPTLQPLRYTVVWFPNDPRVLHLLHVVRTVLHNVKEEVFGVL